MDPEARDKLDQIKAWIASETGATVHAYPRPGRAVRRVILRTSVTAGAPESRPLRVGSGDHARGPLAGH